GGLIALRTAAELSRSGKSPVVGVVLDSPVLSWPSVIAHHARIAYLPRWIGFLVTAVLEAEWTRFLTGIARPIRWRELDGGNLLAQAGIPALVLHSADDDYVPVEPSRQLGRDLRDRVEYHEFTEAGHVRLWNHEPERWERLIADWLSAR
ncbi:MAG: alpha/beta fold hydrolase, partial [Agromyces sp.]